jgi:hypothetical protein
MMEQQVNAKDAIVGIGRGIKECAQALVHSSRVVVFTGAGSNIYYIRYNIDILYFISEC